MTLRIHFEFSGTAIDETVTGATPDDVVAAMRDTFAGRAGFLVGAMVRQMKPLDFAREATRRYNTATKENAPLPASCAEFVEFAVARGIAFPVADS